MHLLVNSKVLLNNRLKESIKQSWHFKKSLHKQGKLQLYINDCPGFESYLNLPNQKLDCGMRLCPLCCDGIGDEIASYTI